MNDASTPLVWILVAVLCAIALQRFPQFMAFMNRQNSRTEPLKDSWFKLALRLGLVGSILVVAGKLLQIFAR